MTHQGPSPIRLALVITELEVGGAERCLTRLACDLDREQFRPEVYSLAAAPQNPALVQHLAASGVPVHFLGARGPFSFVSAVRQLRQHLRRQQPHVVQSFLFHANIAASFLPQSNLVFGVRVADPRGWRLGLERLRARRARRIVCVSQMVADTLRERYGFPAAKLLVIPNGVDVAAFAAASPLSLADCGIGDACPVILFLGRLDRQKGVDWLLQAIHPVLDQQRDAYLVLAGKGDWQKYRSLAGENSSRILWLGWQADAAGLLRRSSLLVLPSRWEGMPNVVLEAMAAGTPVLATPVEGVAELLGARADDQTVAFGNAEQFTRKALRLLTDAPLRTALIEANRAAISRDFSLHRMLADYQQLYLSLASGR